jgi:hypothetical protein
LIKPELLIEIKKKIYDIGDLAKSISWTDRLNDGCSKLEISFISNPGINNGDIIRFVYGDIKFFGVVFKVSVNRSNEVSITAYDKLRYAKEKDAFSTTGSDTASSLTSKMCSYFKFDKGTIADTGYLLAANVYTGTWLDTIYDAISETLQNTGKKYCLRDEYGCISLRDIEDLRLNVVLGENKYCYEFDYERSIDDGFYNIIRIQDKMNSQVIEEKSIDSVNKYGPLQYFEIASEGMNASQIKEKIRSLLRLFNQEKETLTLDCLGDVRIRSGNSFYCDISDINLKKWLIVKSVTHKFIPTHTMSLEVML